MIHTGTQPTDSVQKPARQTAEPPAPAVRLLHIEDNPADALLVQEYIRGAVWGAEIDTVERLGQITAENAAVDCAILDLSLPDASGLEALIALRAISSDLPIIVLSGLEDLDLAVAALRDGADDYLIKNSVDGETLRRAIRYAIERRRLRKALMTEAAATTVATAQVLTATAALEGALRAADATGADGHGRTAPADPATGTHEVSVRVDDVTGEYALRCATCSWAVAASTSDRHSWSERALDLALLFHVDFGAFVADAEPPAVVRSSRPVPDGVFGPQMRAERTDEKPGVGRRTLFPPRNWGEPRTHPSPGGPAS